MNDLSRMEEMFCDIGVSYTLEKEEQNSTETYCNPKLIYNEVLTIENGDERKNGIGYPGFCADFYFLDGVFVGWGAWER